MSRTPLLMGLQQNVNAVGLRVNSLDTAYRDILGLIERGALWKDPGGGRSTSYSLLIER